MEEFPERLIKNKPKGKIDKLSDYMHFLAYLMEDSLLKSGAEPKKDYNFLDLFKLAQLYSTYAFDECFENEMNELLEEI